MCFDHGIQELLRNAPTAPPFSKFVCPDYPRCISTVNGSISSQLNGEKIFTVIDMADCYWHIKLDEPSSYLSTFNTPFGRYKFNRLPFGLSCASDAAQSMIEKHFGDIEGVLAIHDDLIIAAESFAKHDKILRKVFQRAKERNIKFNLRKIQFRVPEVKYLGKHCLFQWSISGPRQSKGNS